MNISEHLREAVDETHDFDLYKLARVARAQGTRRRRRRGVTVVLGAAAATLVASTIGLSAVRHDDGASTMAGSPAGLTSSEPDLSTTGPSTAAGTAAALVYAIAQRQDGEASRFRGRSDAHSYTAGRFDWTPADNSGTTEINVLISHTSQGNRGVTPCSPYLSQCQAVDLPDGSRLTTYELHYPDKGVTIRRVAQLVRPDGVIIELQSLNGTYHHTTRTKKGELTRAEPGLSFAQMRSVVSEPWWGPNLPTYFLRQGADLDDFKTDRFFQ